MAEVEDTTTGTSLAGVGSLLAATDSVAVVTAVDTVPVLRLRAEDRAADREATEETTEGTVVAVVVVE